MKRRINKHESPSDCTINPHHYLSVYDGKLVRHEPPMVLRDDALWAEFLETKSRMLEVESRVLAACTEEPLDAFEVECGKSLWAMIDPDGTGFKPDEWDCIQASLVEHAKKSP